MSVAAYKKLSMVVTVIISVVAGYLLFNEFDKNSSNFIISSAFVISYLFVLIVFELFLMMRFKIPGRFFADGSRSVGIFLAKIALLSLAWTAITYLSNPHTLSNFTVLSVLNAFVAGAFMDIFRRTRS